MFCKQKIKEALEANVRGRDGSNNLGSLRSNRGDPSEYMLENDEEKTSEVLGQCGQFENPIRGCEDKSQLKSSIWKTLKLAKAQKQSTEDEVEGRGAKRRDLLIHPAKSYPSSRGRSPYPFWNTMRMVQWSGQRIGLMSKNINVLVHSITRGFAVPKTVRLRQSLSLNLFGVQTQITGIHLVDKNFKNQIT